MLTKERIIIKGMFSSSFTSCVYDKDNQNINKLKENIFPFSSS